MEGLKDTARKNLKKKFWTTEWIARISAVQILLNENAGENWTKIKVDWKFWRQTRDRVKKFQEDTKLINDGLPWSHTIEKLIEQDTNANANQTDTKADPNNGTPTQDQNTKW